MQDPPPVLQIRVEYKTLPINSLEESGCRIDKEIEFGDKAYELVGAIIHTPGHFWSIVWHKNQVWHYGDGCDGNVHMGASAPGEPYVTTVDQGSCPCVIFYLRKDCCTREGDVKDVMETEKEDILLS